MKSHLVQDIASTACPCMINPFYYSVYLHVTHVRLCTRAFPLFHTASNKSCGEGEEGGLEQGLIPVVVAIDHIHNSTSSTYMYTTLSLSPRTYLPPGVGPDRVPDSSPLLSWKNILQTVSWPAWQITFKVEHKRTKNS